jgi:hypothetical protein
LQNEQCSTFASADPFICLAFFSQYSMAHDLDRLLKKAAQAENVESVKIGGLLLWMGKMIETTDDIPDSAKNINKIEVYDLSDCKADIKQEISREINNLKSDRNYETLIQVREKGKNVKILAKRKKDSIKELLILVSDNDEPVIVRLQGNIKQKDLTALVNKYGK